MGMYPKMNTPKCSLTREKLLGEQFPVYSNILSKKNKKRISQLYESGKSLPNNRVKVKIFKHNFAFLVRKHETFK